MEINYEYAGKFLDVVNTIIYTTIVIGTSGLVFGLLEESKKKGFYKQLRERLGLEKKFN